MIYLVSSKILPCLLYEGYLHTPDFYLAYSSHLKFERSNRHGISFYDSPDTATIICCHILERQAPILYVSHDEDDGMWQFLCGETHETDEAKLVSLKWVFDLDNSVIS